MSLTRPSVSFTYDIDTLEVTASNVIAIRQTEIAVTIVGGADLDGNSPVLNIQPNRSTSPIMSLSTWTVSDSDLVGTLTSNTNEAIAYFEDAGNTEQKVLNVLLYLDGNSDLQFNGICKVSNNPSVAEEDPTDAPSQSISGKINYSDFSAVTDLAADCSGKAIELKVNEILAILRNDS